MYTVELFREVIGTDASTKVGSCPKGLNGNTDHWLSPEGREQERCITNQVTESSALVSKSSDHMGGFARDVILVEEETREIEERKIVGLRKKHRGNLWMAREEYSMAVQCYR